MDRQQMERCLERVAAYRAERVNDFAAPWDINLVCGRLVHWSVFSPLVVG